MSKKAKKIPVAYIKLTIGSQKASPTPAIGSALGQKGVNIMEFCKTFNERTKEIAVDTPVPVVIEVYKDKTFTFVTKTAPVSYFLKKAAGLTKGAKMTGREEPIGKISLTQCISIAKEKMKDLNAYNTDNAVSIIIGSAKSMGIEVES